MSKQGFEINKEIEQNNKLIESMLTPSQFLLNNTVAELLAKNKELQMKCPHEFEDGYCIYCYKSEEEV